MSSSSVGEVPYTLGSTKGVKDALEPPLLPRPNCRAEEHDHSKQRNEGDRGQLWVMLRSDDVGGEEGGRAKSRVGFWVKTPEPEKTR